LPKRGSGGRVVLAGMAPDRIRRECCRFDVHNPRSVPDIPTRHLSVPTSITSCKERSTPIRRTVAASIASTGCHGLMLSKGEPRTAWSISDEVVEPDLWRGQFLSRHPTPSSFPCPSSFASSPSCTVSCICHRRNGGKAWDVLRSACNCCVQRSFRKMPDADERRKAFPSQRRLCRAHVGYAFLRLKRGESVAPLARGGIMAARPEGRSC